MRNRWCSRFKLSPHRATLNRVNDVARRSTPLWGLVSANTVSTAGTRLSQIAVPWLVLTTTGSASRAGVVAFAELAPLVLAQSLGGPWVDRIGAKRVAVWCDAASAVVVALLPLIHAAGKLTFPALVALIAVCGFMRGPSDTAHHAMIPDVVTHTGAATERVTGLVGTTDNLASLIGAGVGGAIVAVLGPINALSLNAASFAVSALILAVATRSLAKPQTKLDPVDAGSSYWRELREGFSYLRRDTLLLGIMLLTAMTNMLNQGYSSVLLPTWAKESGRGAGIIGVLGACMGASALVGSLLAAWWGARMPRFPIYMAGFLLAGAPRWVSLALNLPLPALVAITIGAGFGAGFLNPVLGALQFERIPPALMGRVSAAGLAISWCLMPLGGLLAGWAASSTGITTSLLIFAASYLAVTMAPALIPRWREMSTPVGAETSSSRANPTA